MSAAQHGPAERAFRSENSPMEGSDAFRDTKEKLQFFDPAPGEG